MATTYELWDTETRNRVAVFASRADALAAVRHTLDTQGRSLAETLLLGTEDDDGESEVVARGAGLVAMAVASTPVPERPAVGTGDPTSNGGSPHRTSKVISRASKPGE